MRQIKYCAALIAVALLIGCASQSRSTYSTLASVQAVTQGAYSGYLDLVVRGAIPTNSVPKVSASYDLFLSMWTASVQMAQWNTNAEPPQAVLDASLKVITDINQSKP